MLLLLPVCATGGSPATDSSAEFECLGLPSLNMNPSLVPWAERAWSRVRSSMCLLHRARSQAELGSWDRIQSSGGIPALGRVKERCVCRRPVSSVVWVSETLNNVIGLQCLGASSQDLIVSYPVSSWFCPFFIFLTFLCFSLANWNLKAIKRRIFFFLVSRSAWFFLSLWVLILLISIKFTCCLTYQCEYIQLSFLRIAEVTDDFIVQCTIGISTMEKKDWKLLWWYVFKNRYCHLFLCSMQWWLGVAKWASIWLLRSDSELLLHSLYHHLPVSDTAVSVFRNHIFLFLNSVQRHQSNYWLYVPKSSSPYLGQLHMLQFCPWNVRSIICPGNNLRLIFYALSFLSPVFFSTLTWTFCDTHTILWWWNYNTVLTIQWLTCN